MPSSKIFRVAYGIAKAEGWRYRNETGPSADGTASYVNHNPGNVRSSPFEVNNTGSYSIFVNDMEGLFAIVWQLWVYATGKLPEVLPSESIGDAISTYNDLPIGSVELNDYLTAVEQVSGINRTDPISSILTN